jgi:hypothetical protein
MGFKLAQPLSSSRSTKSELLLCVFASVQESPGIPTGLRKIHRDIHRHNCVPVLAIMPYWLGPADFESRVIVIVVFLGAVLEFQGRVAVHRSSAPAHQSGYIPDLEPEFACHESRYCVVYGVWRIRLFTRKPHPSHGRAAHIGPKSCGR